MIIRNKRTSDINTICRNCDDLEAFSEGFKIVDAKIYRAIHSNRKNEMN